MTSSSSSARARSGSGSDVDSVISTASCVAGTPCRVSAARTSAARPGRASWPLATLTATPPGRQIPRRARAAYCAAEAPTTARPTGTTSAPASTAGRNAEGGRAPSVGCCQRSSDSSPCGRPVRMSTSGWNHGTSSPVSSACRRRTGSRASSSTPAARSPSVPSRRRCSSTSMTIRARSARVASWRSVKVRGRTSKTHSVPSGRPSRPTRGTPAYALMPMPTTEGSAA